MWVKYKHIINYIYEISYIKVYKLNGIKESFEIRCQDSTVIERCKNYDDMLKELKRFEEAILHGDKLFITREVLYLEN